MRVYEGVYEGVHEGSEGVCERVCEGVSEGVVRLLRERECFAHVTTAVVHCLNIPSCCCCTGSIGVSGSLGLILFTLLGLG